MDTEYLKTFCVVAKQQNFRKAADVLKVTQPCVSRRIRALEAELGAVLMDRTTHAVALTEEGKAFLPYAEHSVHLLDEGWQRMLQDGRESFLAVAATPTTSFHWLPDAIAEFHRATGARLKVLTAPSSGVLDMVLDQRIDAGITTVGYASPLIEQEVLFTEHVVCVGSPELSSRFFDSGGQWLGQCLPFIRSTQLWDLIEPAVDFSAATFDVVVEAQYVQVAEALAVRGLGFSMLPLSVASESLRKGALMEVQVPGGVTLRRPIYGIFPRGTNKRRLIQTFRESLVEVLGNIPLGAQNPT